MRNRNSKTFALYSLSTLQILHNRFPIHTLRKLDRQLLCLLLCNNEFSILAVQYKSNSLQILLTRLAIETFDKDI